MRLPESANLRLTKSTRVSIIEIDIGVEKGSCNMSGKKERTRELILEKAYHLFAQKGFRQITMKDVCEETGLSRGGLYSHFSGTAEIFEAIIDKLNQKDEMNFYREMNDGISAVKILNGALRLMEEEMKHPEASLSLAMYEYAGTVDKGMLSHYNKLGEKKWMDLIEYGVSRGEFKAVDTYEIVNVILYAYQGVRMWSRIVDMTPEAFQAITSHIRKQLVKES